MILIYTNTSSTRLQYICKFIFKEQLGVAYSITTNTHGFEAFEGISINYSNEHVEGTNLHIKPHSLLFERDIKEQSIDCFETNGILAFFKTPGPDLAFDIFAASFYLLSRYEEYLPHEKDMYGRFAHENAVAFKNGFLNVPLVNIWIQAFGKLLLLKNEKLNFQPSTFNFQLTYDIDIAWSYRNKGLIRNLGGFFISPSLERFKVLFGMKRDPYDVYEWLDNLHKQYNLQPLYFFLVAEGISRYDKNISLAKKTMQQLVKEHAAKYSIGIHPSWQSNRKLATLLKEKALLESIVQKNITSSRQHYIQFSLPETFERLVKAGIENEHSMGYGSINGFRASVASPFYWYNLQKEEVTSLRLHPFCFMDANSFYEQKQSAEESFIELMHYYNECRKVNGQFISIFHNNLLGTDPAFAGWKEMYSRFISQLPQ